MARETILTAVGRIGICEETRLRVRISLIQLLILWQARNRGLPHTRYITLFLFCSVRYIGVVPAKCTRARRQNLSTPGVLSVTPTYHKIQYSHVRSTATP